MRNKLRIVIGDEIFLEKKHINRLKNLGGLVIYKNNPSSKRELFSRIKDANILILGWSNIGEDLFRKLPKLRLISYWATGYDSVDINAAADYGIAVCNVPRYASEAVAEHVFALLLSFIRKLPQAYIEAKHSKYTWEKFRGEELRGKTIGVIGLGSIGSRVAEIARCFGMKVLVYTLQKEKKRELRVRFVSMNRLLRESDFVTIHVPLTQKTQKMIGRKELKRMKRDAVLINTSRGKVIDEKALIVALKKGEIKGACLDVLSREPPKKNNPLLKMNNVLLTPHIAFNTVDALRRCTDICIDNVEKFLEGVPQNIVNPGYVKNI